MMMGTLMIPYHVTLIPQYILFLKLGWVDTYLPLIVPRFLAGDAFFIFLMVQFFRSMPRELDEAAMIDGCSPCRIYWRIILPLSIPAMATAAIFSFIWTWEDFLGPLVYLNDMRDYTVPLALRTFIAQRQRLGLWPAVRHVDPVDRADRRLLHHLPAPHHPRHRPRRAEAVGARTDGIGLRSTSPVVIPEATRSGAVRDP